ncbi:histidine kinase dimerization/phospho-acceptor domain-containing protein, partial [Acinetobacter baumannii]
MLAAISHDLRTPITSLRLRAELVDDAALRTAMIRTLDEMRVMVEETVRFARDDAHAEATREIDLAELLQELAQ